MSGILIVALFQEAGKPGLIINSPLRALGKIPNNPSTKLLAVIATGSAKSR